jgi:redox-sensitive bicupin YhaK (pirin superfamily)
MSWQECTPPDSREELGSLERVIETRPRDLGGFVVRRALPFARRRMVGPFIFFDHMGPAELGPGEGLNVRPHPHIGLATVTYLFEGEIMHRDSLGFAQPIRPGAVNWMTAGRGIVHSERTREEERAKVSRLHGIQSWVALPLEHEEAEPSFVHYAGADLPAIERPGSRLRLIAGAAFGERSPVVTFSDLFYLEADLEAGAELPLDAALGDRAAYVVHGEVEADGIRHGATQLLVFRPDRDAMLRAWAPTKLMLLGGAPLEGERHIWWNFVASSRERIETAKRAWKEGEFPVVPGDEEEFIPLPE